MESTYSFEHQTEIRYSPYNSRNICSVLYVCCVCVLPLGCSDQTRVISNRIWFKLILCVVFLWDSDTDNFYISLFPCKCPETLRQIYMFGDISLRLWIRKNDRKTKEAVRFITFTLICWDQCREKQTMCRRLGRYFRDNNISCPQLRHKCRRKKSHKSCKNEGKEGGPGLRTLAI